MQLSIEYGFQRSIFSRYALFSKYALALIFRTLVSERLANFLLETLTELNPARPGQNVPNLLKLWRCDHGIKNHVDPQKRSVGNSHGDSIANGPGKGRLGGSPNGQARHRIAGRANDG